MARLFASASSMYGTFAAASITIAPCTFACWWRPTTIGGTQSLVYATSSTATSNRIGLRMSGASGLIDAHYSSVATGGVISSSATGMTANTWGHAAAVFASATSRTAYRNGVAGTPETTSCTPSTIDTMGVAAQYLNPSWTGFCNGRIADIGIWNVALTVNEIAALARGVSPLRIRRLSLIAYLPLHGFASPEPDFIGARSLTLVNSPTRANHSPTISPILTMARRSVFFDTTAVVVLAAPIGTGRGSCVATCKKGKASAIVATGRGTVRAVSAKGASAQASCTGRAEARCLSIKGGIANATVPGRGFASAVSIKGGIASVLGTGRGYYTASSYKTGIAHLFGSGSGSAIAVSTVPVSPHVIDLRAMLATPTHGARLASPQHYAKIIPPTHSARKA